MVIYSLITVSDTPWKRAIERCSNKLRYPAPRMTFPWGELLNRQHRRVTWDGMGPHHRVEVPLNGGNRYSQVIMSCFVSRNLRKISLLKLDLEQRRRRHSKAPCEALGVYFSSMYCLALPELRGSTLLYLNPVNFPEMRTTGECAVVISCFLREGPTVITKLMGREIHVRKHRAGKFTFNCGGKKSRESHPASLSHAYWTWTSPSSGE